MQLTTLAKKSFKGFTLIELLVVIAIIGLLSTIVAAPVQSARKKAKDTKKVAEMKQLQTALSSYANDNGMFPSGSSTVSGLAGLTGLVPTYIPALPTSLTNNAPRDHTMFVAMRSLPVGAASSSASEYKVFAYHLGVTLEVYNPVLVDDEDCWGVASVTSASSSATAGLKLGGPCKIFTSASSASLGSPEYAGSATLPITGSTLALNGVTPQPVGNTAFLFDTNSYVSHPMWPSATADFQGRGVNENATSTCNTIDLCVFDVSDSY